MNDPLSEKTEAEPIKAISANYDTLVIRNDALVSMVSKRNKAIADSIQLLTDAHVALTQCDPPKTHVVQDHIERALEQLSCFVV